MHLGGVLYVYKGEWGLPSIDFDCLRALVRNITTAPTDNQNNAFKFEKLHHLDYATKCCKKFNCL